MHHSRLRKPFRPVRVGHRFVLLNKPAGPVRSSRNEALQDALAAGYATYDPIYESFFLSVPADIVEVVELK